MRDLEHGVAWMSIVAIANAIGVMVLLSHRLLLALVLLGVVVSYLLVLGRAE